MSWHLSSFGASLSLSSRSISGECLCVHTSCLHPVCFGEASGLWDGFGLDCMFSSSGTSLTWISFHPQPPPIVMAPINCTQTAGPSTKDEPLTNPEPPSPHANNQREEPPPLPPPSEEAALPSPPKEVALPPSAEEVAVSPPMEEAVQPKDEATKSEWWLRMPIFFFFFFKHRIWVMDQGNRGVPSYSWTCCGQTSWCAWLVREEQAYAEDDR